MTSHKNNNQKKNNQPQFRLSSSWSKAGIGTCMVISLNELGTQFIAFDIGSTPIFHHAIPASFVFVSHGHLDHIGAIFSHARAHSLRYSTTPTYYVPELLRPKLEKARDAMLELDSAYDDNCTSENGREKRTKSLMLMNIVGVHPGEEIIFQPKKCGKLFARTFAVDHGGHPSLGYVIGRIVKGGLLPQYRNLPSSQIAKLMKEGKVQMKADPTEILEVSYTGDTCAKGLVPPPNTFSSARSSNASTSTITSLVQKETIKTKEEHNVESKSILHLCQAFQAHLIICELTFIDSLNNTTALDSSSSSSSKTKANSKALADKSGHLHIDDVEDILLSHGWKNMDDTKYNGNDSVTKNAQNKMNQYAQKLVFCHLSDRYKPSFKALDLIVDGLPSNLIKYVDVTISSFLDRDDKGNEKEAVVLRCIKENGCISLLDYVMTRDG